MVVMWRKRKRKMEKMLKEPPLLQMQGKKLHQVMTTNTQKKIPQEEVTSGDDDKYTKE